MSAGRDFFDSLWPLRSRTEGGSKKARCKVYKITKGFFGWNVRNEKCKGKNALSKHASVRAEKNGAGKIF